MSLAARVGEGCVVFEQELCPISTLITARSVIPAYILTAHSSMDFVLKTWQGIGKENGRKDYYCET